MTDRIRLLIDTNVWLDRFIRDRAKEPTARKLMALCSKMDDVDVLFTLRSLDDVFWQVKRDIKAWVSEVYGEVTEEGARFAIDRAWQSIDLMCELGTPVGADASDVWFACSLRNLHSDFEDNMVLAAAERAQVDYLVTSDAQLNAKATVAALAPEDMVALLEARLRGV